MKKNWEIKKLGELTLDKMSYGTSSPSCEYDGETRYIRITDINDKGELNEDFVSPISYEEKHVLQDGDIVFARTGATVGKAYCYHSSDEKYVYAGYLIRLRPNRKIVLPDYIFYYTKSKNYLDFISASQVAAAQPNVNAEKYSNLEIPLPPLEEQKRIVKILDEKIAQLETIKANAQTNLQNAKDLFQSQLTKAFSNTSWEKKRLGDVCEIRPSKSETTKYLSDDDNVSFLPMEDLQIMNYYIEPKQSKKLKEISGSYTCFANGDVLLAKVTPCFENGKQGIAKDLTNGVGFGSSEYIVFRPASKLLSEYLYYSLATSDFRENGKKHLLGACGLKRLSKDYVNEYNIPLPPLPEQKRIVEELDTLSEKVRQLQEIYTKQIANCDELKQSLLQKAFSGDL